MFQRFWLKFHCCRFSGNGLLFVFLRSFDRETRSNSEINFQHFPSNNLNSGIMAIDFCTVPGWLHSLSNLSRHSEYQAARRTFPTSWVYLWCGTPAAEKPTWALSDVSVDSKTSRWSSLRDNGKNCNNKKWEMAFKTLSTGALSSCSSEVYVCGGLAKLPKANLSRNIIQLGWD